MDKKKENIIILPVQINKNFYFLRGLYRLSILIILTLALSLHLHYTQNIFADTRENVVILNSDISIKHYSLAHTGFKSVITHPKNEIDLGSKWKDTSKIEKVLHTLNPDVIYCIGSRAYLVAREISKNNTLIFSSIMNWRRFPLSENTYGISSELHPSMQMMMYRYIFPEIKNIGVLYSEEYNKEWIEIAMKNAKDIDINITGIPVKKHTLIASALKKFLPKVDALWLTSDPVVLSELKTIRGIFRQCNRLQKPVFTYSEAFINLGATLIISADIPTVGKQAAQLTLDLLSGHRRKEKIQTPAGTHISLNTKKVKEHKLKLNTDALDSINRIIN